MENPEERILQAATSVFIEKGFDGARMREISEKAGINKALLHYYFRSKENLYEKVIREEIRKNLEALINSIQLHDNFFDTIASFVDNYIDHLRRNSYATGFFYWEVTHGGENIYQIFNEIVTKMQYSKHPQVEMAETAIHVNELENFSPEHFILSVIGMCTIPFAGKDVIEKLMPELDIDSENFIEQRKEEIKKMIFCAIKRGNI